MSVKLTKGMYQEARLKELTFSELLGQERPSKIEGLDAYEFALHEQGINLKSGTLKQFYKTKESSVLFPEFINRNVRIGLVGLNKKDVALKDLIATTTTIDSALYETVVAAFDNKANDFLKVAAGGSFPGVTFKKEKKTVSLSKIGLSLTAPYETLRRINLPLLATHFQLVGNRLSQKLTAYAVHVLLNGDGNNNPTPVTPLAMSYENLVDFLLAMDTWEATVWFAKSPLIKELLLLPELKDSGLFNADRPDDLATPLGNSLKKFNWTGTDLGDDQLFQVDKKAALEMVEEVGAELVETDKIIDRQFEGTTISQVVGFSKIFTDATRVIEKPEA